MKKIFIILAIVALVLLGLLILRGSEDTWLCVSGQWVKHGNPAAAKPTTPCGEQKPIDENQPNSEVIIETPKSGSTVISPLEIKGQARGTWYFEASFPIKLVGQNGQEIATTIAQAQSDWMTEDYVPFEAVLNFSVASLTPATLIFQRDNPSGLPENDKEIEMPIQLQPTETMIIKIFFNNSQFDPEFSCNKVFAVERTIPKTSAVATAALTELFKGVTESEKANGFSTSINPDVKIQKISIEEGIARVDFDKQLEFQVGGSCRVSAIRAQITETLKQFSSVKNVILSIDGRTEDILQP